MYTSLYYYIKMEDSYQYNGTSKLNNCIKMNENTLQTAINIEGELNRQEDVLASIDAHNSNIILLNSNGNRSIFNMEKKEFRNNIIKGLILFLLFGIIVMLIILLAKK